MTNIEPNLKPKTKLISARTGFFITVLMLEIQKNIYFTQLKKKKIELTKPTEPNLKPETKLKAAKMVF